MKTLATLLLLFFSYALCSQIPCGDDYQKIWTEAQRDFRRGNYRPAYEKLIAAKGCTEGQRQLDTINRMQKTVLDGIEGDIRANELVARAGEAEKAGHYPLALGMAQEACRVSKNKNPLALQKRRQLLAEPRAWVRSVLEGHTAAVRSVAFSPDGRQVLTGSSDKTAKLWNLDGQEVRTFAGHTAEVWSVAFSPDGRQVLTGSYDNTAKLWNLDGQEVRTFAGHTAAVLSVAFSPDGRQVLTGSSDKTAKLWNLDGQEVRTFAGHTAEVLSVAFSPDGRQVLTGSYDKTAKLWLVKDTEVEQAAEEYIFPLPVYAADFSASGDTLVIGAGSRHFLAFNNVARLEKARSLVPLTVSGKIGQGFIKETDCLQANDLPTLIGCAKYFLVAGAAAQNYMGEITSADSLRTALVLAKKAGRLQPNGEAAVIMQVIHRILEKFKADSIQRVEKETADSIQSAQEELLAKLPSGLSDSLENAELLPAQMAQIKTLTDSLQAFPQDTVLPTALAAAYGSAAWYQIFTHDYAGAISSVKNGQTISPKTTWIVTNLALGYLLKGDWANAENVYTEFQDRSWKNSGFGDTSEHETFREAFLADLDELERMHLTHPDFAKARALLQKKQ